LGSPSAGTHRKSKISREKIGRTTRKITHWVCTETLSIGTTENEIFYYSTESKNPPQKPDKNQELQVSLNCENQTRKPVKRRSSEMVIKSWNKEKNPPVSGKEKTTDLARCSSNKGWSIFQPEYQITRPKIRNVPHCLS
jgi:hypothetical protein